MISVVIPTFGRPDNLKRSLDSVVNQSIPFHEIILVDDNGDNSLFQKETIKIIDLMAAPNLISIYHKENTNGSVARNSGLKNVSSEYVIFLDDDDELDKNCVKKCLNFIKTNKPSFFYWNAHWEISGKLINTSKYSKEGRIIKDILSLKTDMNTSCLCFKTNYIKSINGFNEKLNRHQDIDVLIRMNLNKDISYLSSVLSTRHLDSESNQTDFDTFLNNKKIFFASIEKNSNLISKKELKTMYAFHNLQLLLYSLKKKKFGYFLTNVYLLVINPKFYIVTFSKLSIFLKKFFIKDAK